MRPLSKVETRDGGSVPFFVYCICACLRCCYVFSAILLKLNFTAEPGWYSAGNPGNCFQYQRSNTEQNWEDSRKVCQKIGGDLAHKGIRDLNVRGYIYFFF